MCVCVCVCVLRASFVWHALKKRAARALNLGAKYDPALGGVEHRAAAAMEGALESFHVDVQNVEYRSGISRERECIYERGSLVTRVSVTKNSC